MSRCVREQRGFTLLEVVVAFAIFALSVGVLYELFAGSGRRVLHNERKAEAQLLAESVLEQVRVNLAQGTVGVQAAREEDLQWHIVVAPLPAALRDDLPWQAAEVSVEVRDADSNRLLAMVKSVELERSR